jgi:hypothetical protein
LAAAGLAASIARPARAGEPTRLEGRWVLRSFVNSTDPHEDFARLRFAAAIMQVSFFSEIDFFGSLTAATWQLNLSGSCDGERFDMRGTQASANTVGWQHDYVGWLAPRWPNASGQVPTCMGTCTRLADYETPDGIVRARLVYSFIGVKLPDDGEHPLVAADPGRRAR